MNENLICEGCKWSRRAPAPYTILCDYPGMRTVKMNREDIYECDRLEEKK